MLDIWWNCSPLKHKECIIKLTLRGPLPCLFIFHFFWISKYLMKSDKFKFSGQRRPSNAVNIVNNLTLFLLFIIIRQKPKNPKMQVSDEAGQKREDCCLVVARKSAKVAGERCEWPVMCLYVCCLVKIVSCYSTLMLSSSDSDLIHPTQ